MRRIIPILILVLLFFYSFTPIGIAEEERNFDEEILKFREETKNAKRIGIQEAFNIYKSGKAILISVDGASYYKSRHILGAINIPYEILEKVELNYPKDRKILFYCR